MELTHDRRTRWKWPGTAALVVLLVCGLLGGGLLVASPASASPLPRTTFITWNMQGGSNGVDSKWGSVVKKLARQASVISLQEAGPKPPGEMIGNKNGVQEYRWNAGTKDRPQTQYIYFKHTDTADPGRVNTAVVTRERADDYSGLGVSTPGRDAVGVRLGNNSYFSFHALARSKGGDAPSVLMALAVASSQGIIPGPWTVGADWNREPASLQGSLPAGARIYNCGQATQQSGGELDYFVASQDYGPIPTNRLSLGSGASDHYAVQLGTNQPAAEEAAGAATADPAPEPVAVPG